MNNNLRLGNIIVGYSISGDEKRYHIPMTVVGIFEDVIYADFEENEGDVFEYRKNEFEGMPLTEEIILNCGFYDNECNYLMNLDNVLSLEINKELDAIYLYDNYANTELIDFVNARVHDLQNIYFTFTMNELNIKL